MHCYRTKVFHILSTVSHHVNVSGDILEANIKKMRVRYNL